MSMTLTDRDSYTGLEPALDAPMSLGNTRSDWYCLHPSALPGRAVPIFDESLRLVVGFRTSEHGVSRIYDIHGQLVGMEELPLQPSPIDPIDFLFVAGGLFRLGAGFARRTGVRSAAISIGQTLRDRLKARFQAVRGTDLKFTATTVAHMQSYDRFVPLQVLALAIKHGSRSADPQKVAGASKYVAIMTRNGRTYRLHVVLREADKTILHFHFSP